MPDKSSIKYLKKTLVLQQDQSDCGVACLLSLIRFYKGNNSLENLRKLSGTNIQGTTLLGLYQAAQQLGFETTGCEADMEALIKHGEPVILHIEPQENFEHYVVCYGYENSIFTIGDPVKGIIQLSYEEVETLWKTKTCLTLKPTSQFIIADTIKKDKKLFIFNLLKEDKKLIILSLLLGFGIALLGMSLSLFSQKLIDDILPKQKISKLIGGIILLTVMLLVKVGFTALRELTLNIQTQNFNNRVISSFYNSLLTLPKPFFDTRKIGELTARLNDTDRIQRTIRSLLGNYIIEFLILLITTIFLLFYSWQSGIIIIASLPLYYYLVFRYNKKIITSQQEVMQNYALNEANYISSMNGIATIKNLNRENYFFKLNQKTFGNYQKSIFFLGKINIRLSVLIGIASVIFIIFILTFNAVQVWNKVLTLGEFMAIIGMSGSLIPSVTNLALINIPLNEAKVAFDRMYDFTSVKKEKTEGICINSIQQIEFQNLSFRFPGRKKIFDNVNLCLQKGILTALIGESGSGKTTLGQILQKFYEWEEGTIIVNNAYNLNRISLPDWRSKMGVIPQEIHIFNGTVLYNLIIDEQPDLEKLQNIIAKYQLTNFIQNLPNGLSTLVGEEGINLSGGQKQIIGWIRVLYKNPEFYILDEPTSALDKNSEQLVLNILKDLKENSIILLITHRLSNLNSLTNKIYELENGTIKMYQKKILNLSS